MPSAMIIAIDGSAASGKGTLAKRLAEHFDYARLDTGLLYRAVGLTVLRAGEDPYDPDAAGRAAEALTSDMLDDPALRSAEAGSAGSKVAAHPNVREALLAFQRDFARNPPGGKAGAVLDGRDIGTVVCPDADIKFFVSAERSERARRRFNELRAAGAETTLEAVEADLEERDRRDSARSEAPMAAAPDAILLDTSELDIDAVTARALDAISEMGAA